MVGRWSAASFWRRVDGWLSEADVDPIWRINKVKGRASLFAGFGVACYAAQLVIALLLTPEEVATQVIYAVVMVVLALVHTATKRPTSWRVYELLEVIAIVAVSVGGVAYASLLDVERPPEVRRGEWRWFGFVIPIILAVRVRTFLCFAAFHHITYSFSNVFQALHAKEELSALPTSFSYTFVSTGLFVAVSVLQGRMLRSWQLSELNFKQEQRSTQSLVSMLCDGSFLLGSDGDTIVNSSEQFDFLMGRAMAGASLEASTMTTSSDPSADQLQHLKSVIKTSLDSVRGDRSHRSSYGSESVIGGAVPITLEGPRNSCMPVTLFIVLHVAASAKGDGTNFLVGVSQAAEMENAFGEVPPLPATDLAPGPPSDMGRVDNHEVQSILPPSEQGTVSSAAIFDAEKQSLEVVFDQIEELGVKEHWMLSMQQVKVRQTALARGGQGAVLAGSFCGAPVVIKVMIQHIDRTARRTLKSYQAMIHELRMLRHCRHPNLVQLQGALITRSPLRLGIVLERADGGDLNAWPLQLPPPSDARVFRVILHVARALWYLHTLTKPIVHGDLKSGNVLIFAPGPHETAKVADFGMATLYEAAQVPVPKGTLAWLAPEVFNRETPVHPPSDIFSLGRLLQFLISGGQLITRAMSLEELRSQLACNVVAHPDADPSGPLAAEVGPIADACLAVAWEQRLTICEVCEQLRDVDVSTFDDSVRSALHMQQEMDSGDVVPRKAAL